MRRGSATPSNPARVGLNRVEGNSLDQAGLNMPRAKTRIRPASSPIGTGGAASRVRAPIGDPSLPRKTTVDFQIGTWEHVLYDLIKLCRASHSFRNRRLKTSRPYGVAERGFLSLQRECARFVGGSSQTTLKASA